MELIEREASLIELKTHLEKVSDGEGHCVFISGEAGLGKSALVKQFCKEMPAGSTIYQGVCDALFTPRLLAPLHDILWQVNPDLVAAAQSADARSTLFSLFFHELSKREETVLIVFEDIHWADDATLDFIKFFARRITQLRCLFILTYRDDDPASRHSIRTVLRDISPDVFSRLQLSPLSEAAVARMANEKGYDAEHVYRITGGNPFYVNEILASYSPGVPENIKDSILAVYDRQDEGTQNAWQITSVMPEGLEVERFSKIRSSWSRAMEHCFAMNVILVKNGKVFFKHELYRKTIEESLSAFKRQELNKTILELLLDSFEERGEIERILHYALNASEKKLVLKYAPIAAAQAARSGAHKEATNLYLTAIENAEECDDVQLADLYHSYAFECYRSSQISDAIRYVEKALHILQNKESPELLANSMQFLSKLCWLNGNKKVAETWAIQAVALLDDLPSSRVKAMGFCQMSFLMMQTDESEACFEWSGKAITMAGEINDEEVRSAALINLGAAGWRQSPADAKGQGLLRKGLEVAMANAFHEIAVEAFIQICHCLICDYEYERAGDILVQLIVYCEENDFDVSQNDLLFIKARLLLGTGNWKQSAAISRNLLDERVYTILQKINVLNTLATVALRTGSADAKGLLQNLKELAFPTGAHQHIIPAAIALLEYEWLYEEPLISEQELSIAISLAMNKGVHSLNSNFACWLKKIRGKDLPIGKLYDPYAFLQAGSVEKAAAIWKQKGCAYEEALTLSEGSEAQKLQALIILQNLDADIVLSKLRMEMRILGIKKIPRGKRESTRTNPAGLTTREIDVLQLLQKGRANKEIAAELFISPKTADHHIASIFFKLDVNTRAKAVDEASRIGVLK